MKRFFAPLGIFVIGNLFLLIVSLFLPALDTAVSNLDTETAAVSGFAWGWDWVMTTGVARLFFYLVVEGFILFATAKAFLATRG